MFQSAKEVEASLRAAGLARWATGIAKLSRPAVALRSRAVGSEDESPLGGSKLGGLPDVPEGFVWPTRPPYPREGMTQWMIEQAQASRRRLADEAEMARYRGDKMPDGYASEEEWKARTVELELNFAVHWERSAARRQRSCGLDFICQIDLSEIARHNDIALDLPAHGRLLFFYDAMEQPWGAPGEEFGARLLWDGTPAGKLVRQQAPQFSEDGWQPYPPLALSTFSFLSPPPFECTAVEGLGLAENMDAFYQWWTDLEDTIGNAVGRHRVGGWPVLIQHEMEPQAHRLTEAARALPRADARPDEWRLVMQIDSDDERNGMLWGDNGRLYVWMHQDDIAGRRFDRARVLLQCY